MFSSLLGAWGLDWAIRGFEACSHVGLSLFDLPRFFLVELLVELGCGQGLDERFVFPLDFACTDEPPLPPLLLDRLLPAQSLSEEFLKLRDSETKRLLLGRFECCQKGLPVFFDVLKVEWDFRPLCLFWDEYLLEVWGLSSDGVAQLEHLLGQGVGCQLVVGLPRFDSLLQAQVPDTGMERWDLLRSL